MKKLCLLPLVLAVLLAGCLYYAAQRDNSELLLYWDPALQRLYVLESFL